MGKHTIRYRNSLMGWNPSNDFDWEFRKILSKHERDKFDAMPEDERRLIVQQWEIEGVGFKF